MIATVTEPPVIYGGTTPAILHIVLVIPVLIEWGKIRMAEYIKRENAVAKFQKLKDKCESLKDAIYLDGVMAVLDVIPAADVAEVVRCKDCIHYKEGRFLTGMKFCFRLKHPKKNEHIGYPFSDDGFCSYGVRKDVADNGKAD